MALQTFVIFKQYRHINNNILSLDVEQGEFGLPHPPFLPWKLAFSAVFPFFPTIKIVFCVAKWHQMIGKHNLFVSEMSAYWKLIIFVPWLFCETPSGALRSVGQSLSTGSWSLNYWLPQHLATFSCNKHQNLT